MSQIICKKCHRITRFISLEELSICHMCNDYVRYHLTRYVDYGIPYLKRNLIYWLNLPNNDIKLLSLTCSQRDSDISFPLDRFKDFSNDDTIEIIHYSSLQNYKQCSETIEIILKWESYYIFLSKYMISWWTRYLLFYSTDITRFFNNDLVTERSKEIYDETYQELHKKAQIIFHLSSPVLPPEVIDIIVSYVVKMR